MPVVLSHTVNPDSLQAEDFSVVGQARPPRAMCATLRPAGDVDENRTVLLIGEFGNADDDPPVKVLIVMICSPATDSPQVNFRGTQIMIYSSQRRPRDYFCCGGAKGDLVAVGSERLAPTPPNGWFG